MKSIFLLAVFFLFIPGRAFAQGKDRVLEIVVEGQNVAPEEVRGWLRTKVGEPKDPKTVQEDIVSLWQTKRIRTDEVLEERIPGGIRLIFRVVKLPAIHEISIRGNREFKRDDLLDAAKLTPGVPVDEIVAARARGDLIQYYRDQGYFFADVSLKYDLEANRANFEIMEGPLVRIREILFEGNQSVPSSYFFNLRRNLSSVMQLNGKWLFFRGSEFKENTLKEDLIQLRRVYRSEGFRDAVVEVKELEFNQERDAVTLHILVNEGPRYVVSSIELEGNEAFSKEELMPLIQLKPGDYYTSDRVMRDHLALSRYYGERGYPDHPSITDHWNFQNPQEIFSPGDAKVKVIYKIQEGKKVTIRDVQIQGNEYTQDRVIRRTLTFFPGEPVNTNEIAKSIARLNSLNFFKDDRGLPSIRYSYADTEDALFKDLILKVDEGQTGEFKFGGGVSSVEGFFATILLRKNNFDLFNPPSSWDNAFKEIFDGRAFTGAGQTLVLSLSPGTRISNYNLLFREPDLFGEHIKTTVFDANLFERIRNYQDYREKKTGANVTLGKNWSEHWATYLTFRNELVELKDIQPDAPQLIFDLEGFNSLRSTRLELIHADLDIPLDPTSGYQVQLSQEGAGGLLGGEFDFYKTVLSGRLFIPVSSDARGRAYTLLMKGTLGYASAFGDSPSVPFPERFFTGGPDSIRGFGFRGVGPVQFGNPTGGEVLGLAGAEFRFPIYSTPFADGLAEQEWVRGVFFLDSGSLGSDIHDANFREWRLSAGTGIRIRLPFLQQATIVLDYGVPIFQQDSDSRRIFSFSIGATY